MTLDENLEAASTILLANKDIIEAIYDYGNNAYRLINIIA